MPRKPGEKASRDHGRHFEVLMNIVQDDLSSTEVAAMLNGHLEGMAIHSPPENVHALDINALRAPDITFWTARNNDELLGCGALKELNQKHGEIKSMRTAQAYLGQGVATAILRHLIQESRKRSYFRLSLETGSGSAFAPAHSLYRKFGFEYCGPFADYRADSFSSFMTLRF